MKPSWLIEDVVVDKTTERLIAEIKNQGMVVKVVPQVPARSTDTYLDLFPKGDCVVFIGTLGFADQVRRESSWLPGVYYHKTAFDCTSYYPAFGSFLLTQQYAMIPYGDLIRQEETLYGHFGIDDCIFIRPNKGNKVFAGQLIERKDYAKDLKHLGYGDVEPQELCVVSPPRNVIDEWRFVIVDQVVITGSQYTAENRVSNRRGYPQEAFDLAQKAAKCYNPDRAWCLDICQTASGNYYVLEIGCFSCGGLYLAEMEPVVREVSRVAVEDWKSVREI
jgi:hypothetical protein